MSKENKNVLDNKENSVISRIVDSLGVDRNLAALQVTKAGTRMLNTIIEADALQRISIMNHLEEHKQKSEIDWEYKIREMELKNKYKQEEIIFKAAVERGQLNDLISGKFVKEVKSVDETEALRLRVAELEAEKMLLEMNKED